MTHSLGSVVALLLALSAGPAAAEPRAFTYVPADPGLDVPWRVVLRPDGKVESQQLWSGIRRTKVAAAKIDGPRIEFAETSRWTVVLVRQADGSLLLHRDGDGAADPSMVFRASPEWDEKFEEAQPVPRTKAEAIATLRKVLKPEDLAKLRAMKSADLIRLHHGFGTWLRNALGLWEADSPLRRDLGGGHPDSASTELLEALWQDLQRDGDAGR